MQDGNIHCHVNNVSRRNGGARERLAVAAAAYVSGQRLWSQHERRHVSFDFREDVVFSDILLPEGAPAWTAERATLWNKVDTTAKRSDARLAKSIEAAIARDIPANMRSALLQEFVAPYVALGCVADVAIHEDGTDHNPHVHILLTTRFLTKSGFGDKITALEQRAFVKRARERWALITNKYLEKCGSTLRVDHRSYKARGIEAEPTTHRGPNATERRNKREHARRVREEQSMKKPTTQEQRDYPALTQRETWPPEPAASPDMTAKERDEHRRYWEERKIERLEMERTNEPEFMVQVRPEDQPYLDEIEADPFIMPPENDLPWYEQAANKAHQEHRPNSAAENEYIAERRERQSIQPNRDYDEVQARYEADVLRRAKAMYRNRAEHEALESMRNADPDQRRFVEDFILQERMQAIREQDQQKALKELEPSLKQRLDNVRFQLRGEEQDLPVLGPDRTLISQRELDEAQRRMLEEHEREEDRER